MSLDDLKSRIQTTKKQPKPSEYDTWRASVLSKYPDVFFPTLSAKKKKILKAVVQRLQSDTSGDWQGFAEWVVDSWPYLHKMTNLDAFEKYKYPELDLVLYNYDKLINFYVRSQLMTKTADGNKKKKLDLSMFNGPQRKKD